MDTRSGCWTSVCGEHLLGIALLCYGEDATCGSQPVALVQAFVLLCVYLAKEVDTIIARSQRRELGLCEECGGLFDSDTCEEWRCPLKDNL